MHYVKKKIHLFRIVIVLLVSLLFFSKVFGADPKTKTDNELLEVCLFKAQPLFFDDLSAFVKSKKTENALTLSDKKAFLSKVTSVCDQRAREVSDKENAMHLKKKIEAKLMSLLAICFAEVLALNPSANN